MKRDPGPLTYRPFARLAAMRRAAPMRSDPDQDASCRSQPSALSANTVTVDRENGIIRNASIITAGPAVGHGFAGEIDASMLAQVAASINAQPNGVKVRLTHVELQGSPLGGGPDDIVVRVGRCTNARVVGNQVRGDIHLGAYARSSPQGDLWTYLLDLAQEAPEDIGLSIMFPPPAGPDEPIEVLSVDFVGVPAANPHGLLSSGSGANGAPPGPATEGGSQMNPKLRRYLETFCGLSRDAGEEEAKRCWRGLKGALRKAANALAEGEPEVPADAGEPPAAPPQETAADPMAKADLTPMEGETEQAFVERFINDEDMQVKYPDGAERTAKAKEIYATFMTPAEEVVQDVAEEQVAEETPAPGAPVVGASAKNSAAAAALAADRRRRKAIMALAKAHNLSTDWAQGLCDRGVSLAQARELVALAQAHRPVAVAHVGPDRNLVSLAASIGDAIRLRAGASVTEPHERARKLRALSLLDQFREYLIALGVPDARYLGRPRLAELLSPLQFRRAYPQAYALAQSTSDFTNILADAINKSLRQAYEDAPKTWNIWARRVTNADFKTIRRAALSEAPDLVARDADAGEIHYVTLSDTAETYALAEYAAGIILTRKAIINDDLDAFNRIPTLQALAAARKEDDVAYAILTANAALADGYNLFSSDHSNLIAAGSGGAPTVSTLAATEKLLMKQKGPKSAARLDLRARFVLVPSSIYRVTQQLISSPVDPAKSNDAPNPFYNEGLIVVPSARLDDDSTTAWYLAADYNRIDTIEVCFLEGEEEPQLAQETDFDTDNQKYKVRHTVAAKAIDFRGLAKNAGA